MELVVNHYLICRNINVEFFDEFWSISKLLNNDYDGAFYTLNFVEKDSDKDCWVVVGANSIKEAMSNGVKLINDWNYLDE
jgi:hypothetical protein